MDSASRSRFFEALYGAVTGGYRSPLVLRGASTRFTEAISRLGLVWYNGVAWWYDGARYLELYTKELRSGIAWCFDRAGSYIRGKDIRDLSSRMRYRMEGDEIDGMDYMHAVFRNGMVDMGAKRLDLRPHSQAVFTTRYFDFDYEPEAKCPLWRQFLKEVLPDGASQDVLQEFLGAVFVDRAVHKVESMLWLFGDGANGKSVVFEVVMGVLGKDNVTTRDMRDLCHASRGQFALSDIEGKLLNYCSDVRGEFTFSDMAKKLISGEPTHAERKFENSRMMVHIPLFMANTNTLPKLGDNTNAWARRVKIIPFQVTIPEEKQDKSLASKLLEEKSGIFSWMMEGRRRFLAQGCKFTESPLCDRMMFSYRAAGYDVLDFMLAENLSSIRQYVGDEGKEILTRDLYKVFLSWLEVESAPSGCRLSLASFRTKLKRYGYIPYHSREGSAIRAYSATSPSAQRSRKKKIEEEPALQVPQIAEAAQAAMDGDSGRREDVLERIRGELEDKI